MSNSSLLKAELIREKKQLEKMLNICKKKLKKLNNNNHISSDENEIPMPLKFNIITDKNFQREKSLKYTKKLINKLKKRSQQFENIVIKKEIEEEIEIPSLEYV